MKKAVFVALFVFILLVAGEIFFGIVFFLKDTKSRLINLENTKDHAYLYYTCRPDKEKAINEDGLYTKKGRARAPGKYRILLTGGSVARSLHAPYDKTISYYLEEELNKRLKTDKIEVINAAMPGYVAEQGFIFIQLVLRHYRPDMIIGLDGYNDLMSFKLNRYTGFIGAPQNWRDFMVIRDGKEAKRFYYRFKGLFRNLSRAVSFVSVSRARGYFFLNVNFMLD